VLAAARASVHAEEAERGVKTIAELYRRVKAG
jgi:hypothetical protein